MKKEHTQKRLTIADWGESERPREKYLEKGFSALSDAELIAILLRSGSVHESAVDMGKRLLRLNQDSLNALADMPLNELMKIYGMGEAKAITIKAAFELGRRRRSEKISPRKKIEVPTDIVELMQDKIAALPHEEFWVVFLNQGSLVLGIDNFGKGGITSTIVDVRLVLKKALEYNATALLLCHNHPSGVLKPSKEDLHLTKQIQETAKLFNIRLLDHLILSKDHYLSFSIENLL